MLAGEFYTTRTRIYIFVEFLKKLRSSRSEPRRWRMFSLFWLNLPPPICQAGSFQTELAMQRDKQICCVSVCKGVYTKGSEGDKSRLRGNVLLPKGFITLFGRIDFPALTKANEFFSLHAMDLNLLNDWCESMSCCIPSYVQIVLCPHLRQNCVLWLLSQKFLWNLNPIKWEVIEALGGSTLPQHLRHLGKKNGAKIDKKKTGRTKNSLTCWGCSWTSLRSTDRIVATAEASTAEFEALRLQPDNTRWSTLKRKIVWDELGSMGNCSNIDYVVDLARVQHWEEKGTPLTIVQPASRQVQIGNLENVSDFSILPTLRFFKLDLCEAGTKDVWVNFWEWEVFQSQRF